MNELIRLALDELTAGRPCVLVTVIAASGSVPRGAGAYMLVGAAGRLAGTIGGAKGEYLAILRAQQLLTEKHDELWNFELTPDKDAYCGGAGSALLRHWGVDALAEVESLLRRLEAAEPFYLLLPLNGGPLVLLTQTEKLPLGYQGLYSYQGEKYYAEAFNYDGLVYLFGGGHVAQATLPLLVRVGFRCVVVEDRDEYLTPELFPGAARLIKADFEHLEKSLSLNERDYAAIMTRGHSGDLEAERFCLQTPVAYIGVMGSATKARLTRAELGAAGFTTEQLARITTPIGLAIGSETPAEIAVSIAAQLIQVRAERYRQK